MGRPRVNFDCTVEDCERKAYIRGLCEMHRRRMEKHGTTDLVSRGMIRTPPPYPEDATVSRAERLIWAAGFFDGEGCVCLTRRKLAKGNPSCFLQVSAVNAVKEPLELLRGLFGGSITQKIMNRERREAPESRWRDTWHWYCSCRQAAVACKEMLPYLVVKAEQARIAIAFQEGMVKQYGRPGWPEAPGEYERREQLRERLMALNKRGPR